MIPTSYRENENCNNCIHAKKGRYLLCGHDGSKIPDPMTKEWLDDHIVSEDGVCDEWSER